MIQKIHSITNAESKIYQIKELLRERESEAGSDYLLDQMAEAYVSENHITISRA